MANYIVQFDEERCKGCCVCISVCPKKILEMKGTTINSRGYHPIRVTDQSLCIGCTNCALMCPDGAIRIDKEQGA